MKTDFEAFPIGHVHNPLSREVATVAPADVVTIEYPSRLEAMALDPSKIADNNNLMLSSMC